GWYLPRAGVLSRFFRRGFSDFSSSSTGRTHVDWKAKGDVAVVQMGDPRAFANSWTVHMQTEMMDVLDEICENDAVQSAVVTSSKPGSFLVGVDVNEIQKCETKEDARLLSQYWQMMMDKFQYSPKPIVAAIDGWCVNGGLEFITACQYRVATKNPMTIFASRETRLGLMPSAGGTVRLTNLVGPYRALDMMLEGYAIRADAAKKIGLVQKVIDTQDSDYLEDVAIDSAREIVDKIIPLIPQRNNLLLKTQDYFYSFPKVRKLMFEHMRQKVMDKETFFNAPIKIIETVKTALEQGPVAGYHAESKNFGLLAKQSDTKALIKLHQDLIAIYEEKLMQDM
uniref:enoyl-CoA hydratase n=1 Tax=Astyanax mexicanus TaxID=7994 RepID=A0A8B9J7Q0_ASTMX